MLKGKSVIELTDVRTNNKEVYEEENLVTNAVPDLLRLNPSALMYPQQSNKSVEYYKELFPISKQCYGGILLFEDLLDENPNEYFVSSNNQIIGYASNDINSTDDTKRGSANLTESMKLDNGYKFVWDFSTSQANGKISSLALTNNKGGRFFYGDKYGRESCFLLNRVYCYPETYDNLRIYLGMVECDIEDNSFISIYPRPNKTIDIIRLKESFTSISLNTSIHSRTFQNIDKISISVEEFFEDRSYWYKANFFDGKDGFWYGFNSKNVSDNVELRRIKIKKDDMSIKFDKWTLSNVNLKNLGEYRSSDTNYPFRNIGSVMKNGYIYAFAYTSDALYKINVNNPVDITKIDLGFKSNYYYGKYSNNYLYEWGDYILGYDFIVNSRDEVIKNYGKNNFSGIGLDYISTPLITIGPFMIGYSSDEETLYKTLYLHTPYLGTINNLSSPILKTADKTMKITYTLTEEE